MIYVVDHFKKLLPPKARKTPSGWFVSNAVCCVHQGQSPDTRRRGGFYFDTGIIYHCFNCGFKTGWRPGVLFHGKIRKLAEWLGASQDDIKKLVFESMKSEGSETPNTTQQWIDLFETKKLPDNSDTIYNWANSDKLSDVADDLSLAIEYLTTRGFDPFDPNFYWSSEKQFKDRVIIPFHYNGNTVGYTARKVETVKKDKFRYISDQPSHFVFNYDNQQYNQKYLFVTEGPFDALAVQGVAILTNTIAEQQSRIINSLNSENVIIIPDQDTAGLALFDYAIEYNWSIASPNWEDNIKDSADAVLRYGRLFVTIDAIMTSVKGKVKISLAKKKLEHKLQRN